MNYTEILRYVKNGLISDEEALNRLEDMKRDSVIDDRKFIYAKSLLFV